MTAKQFLRKAYYLDESINTKLEQVHALHELSVKTSSTLSLAPGTQGEKRKFEDIILKAVALENEIDKEVDALIDLKTDINTAIIMIDDPECRLVLEKRYMNLKSFEEIADEMNMGIKNVYRLHDKGAKEMKIPDKYKNK